MMRGRLSSRLRCIANEHLQLSQRALRCSGAKRWSTTSTGATHTGGRQWSTPLAKSLGEAITTTGPIPVATYMRQCLTSMDGGYYTSAAEGRDQFGQKGDFVTSPEISQTFGELIGLWVVAEWIAQGRKSDGVCLMEMGPGRGTLMDDMLRTIRNFKPLAQAIQGIYLVEASPSLREAQHRLLCGDNALTETDVGYSSTSKYTPDLQIIWCEDIRFVPKGICPVSTSASSSHSVSNMSLRCKHVPFHHCSRILRRPPHSCLRIDPSSSGSYRNPDPDRPHNPPNHLTIPAKSMARVARLSYLPLRHSQNAEYAKSTPRRTSA